MSVTANSLNKDEFFYGHKACAGCGGSLAVRGALKVLGKNTVAVLPAGCMSAVGFNFPQLCFANNAIISTFAGTASMLTGIEAGFRARGITDFTAVGFAGDGGTADIGIQALSGAVDRDDDILYICYDESDRGIEVLDFKNREYYQLMVTNPFTTRRLRGIDFAKDGTYMLVAVDNGYDERDPQPSVYILTRNNNGTFKSVTPQRLTLFGQCNTVAVHPNGEIYFNSYAQGQVFRFELDDYLNALNYTPNPDNPDEVAPVWNGKIVSPTAEDKTTGFEEVFQIKDSGNEFRICIHPSGKYAYLIVVNKNYILRTDYNETTKRFTVPYTVAGAEQQGGWVDAVGTSARVNRPYNGVFVKNPEYEAQGRDDVYDFYFTDCLNFCVRYLTPDGVVRTFAGRGKATNGNIWGTEDGDLREVARFRDVSGIAYSEREEAFYVLDQFNARIRRIGVEVEQDQVNAGESITE